MNYSEIVKSHNNSIKKNRIVSILRTCESIGERAEAHYDFLQTTAQSVQSDPNIIDFVRLFHGLGNQDRFLILELLRTQDRCVCELEAALNKTQPAISRDLKILEDLGILIGWKKGKFTHYSFNQDRLQLFASKIQEWTNSITNLLLKT
jgi:ArsR family transcriptional regulator